ncbi:MAG TPA: CBS domain-containing protein [Thermomicrobiales bacterium]|nr:CBS domain-containing protein [Thermomicrobiales bacterium]
MAAEVPVANIMTTSVVSVSRTTEVTEVARLMVEHAVSGLPVVEGDRVVGIVTERDLIAQEIEFDPPAYGTFLDAIFRLPWDKSDEELRRILATRAEQLMSEEVITVQPTATVRDAASLMYKRRVNPLPVVDEQGRMVGIISRSDIVQLLTEM